MKRHAQHRHAAALHRRMRGSTMVEYVLATGITLSAMLVPFGDTNLSALQRLLIALRADHSGYMYMAGLPSLPRNDGTGGPIPPGGIGSGGNGAGPSSPTDPGENSESPFGPGPGENGSGTGGGDTDGGGNGTGGGLGGIGGSAGIGETIDNILGGSNGGVDGGGLANLLGGDHDADQEAPICVGSLSP